VRIVLLVCVFGIVITMHPAIVIVGGAVTLVLRRYQRHLIRILY
jgi:hypothetical protein